MNNKDVINQNKINVTFIVKTIGKIIIISISNTKKITAIKKKWIENGVRLSDIELNPHSNGVLLWVSIIDFFLITEIKPVITNSSKTINNMKIIKELIILFQ